MDRVYKETKYLNTVVCNDGNIYNTYYGEPYVKKNVKVKDGASKVRVKYNKNKRIISVAKEIALAFIPNPSNHRYVKHLDEDRQNNTVENLYWSKSNYMDYSAKIGMKYSTTKEFLVEGFEVVDRVEDTFHLSCNTCGRKDKVSRDSRKNKKCSHCTEYPLSETELSSKNFSEWNIVENIESVLVRNKSKKTIDISCNCCGEKATLSFLSFSNKNIKHYCTKQKSTRETLANTVQNMKQRCYNPSTKSYKTYGAKGITVCEEWKENTSNFVDWALANGYEKGLEIDRIDTYDNYYPENCRFVTRAENSRNMTTNILTKDMVRKIKNTNWGDKDYRQIADILNPSKDRVRLGGAIGNVLRGGTWVDVV